MDGKRVKQSMKSTTLFKGIDKKIHEGGISKKVYMKNGSRKQYVRHNKEYILLNDYRELIKNLKNKKGKMPSNGGGDDNILEKELKQVYDDLKNEEKNEEKKKKKTEIWDKASDAIKKMHFETKKANLEK